MATLTLISNKIVNDLISYNCVPNKTFKIREIPQIPKSLYRHFIRGYFDGDGSVHKKNTRSKKQFSFSILGQKEFIEQIQGIINKELNIELLLYQDKRTENLYFTATSNKKCFAKIYSYLYDGATRYMERKKQVFEELFYIVLDEYSLLNIFELNPKIILKENPYWVKEKEVK
jgi:intein/homing endonuclease